MEQKVTPQNIRGLGNICDNFSEDDFTKINADTILQENVDVNNVSLRCFRVQMKGTPITISVSGSTSLNYNQASTYGITVKTENNQPVPDVTVGLYINNNLIVSSNKTNSSGYTTISFTPNVSGDLTLEFKVLPQGSYAMVKTTKNIRVKIGTVITVYSPYWSGVTPKLAGLAVWVTTEDGNTIIDTTVSYTHNGSTYHIDTQPTATLESLEIPGNIVKGDSLTFSYGGNTYYSPSTVTKIAGSDETIAVSTPPSLPGNNVIYIPPTSNKIIGGK